MLGLEDELREKDLIFAFIDLIEVSIEGTRSAKRRDQILLTKNLHIVTFEIFC